MPQFLSDVLSLLQTATTWLLLIIPVSGSLVFGYFSWRKSVTEDDAMIDKLNRNIKNTIIWSAVALGGNGIITTILSFINP